MREGATNGKGPDTRSEELVSPKDRHPTTPKPPGVPLDNPPPWRMRDMTPIFENPSANLSKPKMELANRNTHAWVCERVIPSDDGEEVKT